MNLLQLLIAESEAFSFDDLWVKHYTLNIQKQYCSLQAYSDAVSVDNVYIHITFIKNVFDVKPKEEFSRGYGGTPTEAYEETQRYIDANREKIIAFGKNIMRQAVVKSSRGHIGANWRYKPVSDQEVLDGFLKSFNHITQLPAGSSLTLGREIKFLQMLGVKVPTDIADRLRAEAKEADSPKARLMRILGIPEWNDAAISKRLLTMLKRGAFGHDTFKRYFSRLKEFGWENPELEAAILKSAKRHEK